jgi:hypothetical protein
LSVIISLSASDIVLYIEALRSLFLYTIWGLLLGILGWNRALCAIYSLRCDLEIQDRKGKKKMRRLFYIRAIFATVIIFIIEQKDMRWKKFPSP